MRLCHRTRRKPRRLQQRRRWCARRLRRPVVDQLEGESEEEKASRLAAAKEDKMRKVIRCGRAPCM